MPCRGAVDSCQKNNRDSTLAKLSKGHSTLICCTDVLQRHSRTYPIQTSLGDIIFRNLMETSYRNILHICLTQTSNYITLLILTSFNNSALCSVEALSTLVKGIIVTPPSQNCQSKVIFLLLVTFQNLFFLCSAVGIFDGNSFT